MNWTFALDVDLAPSGDQFVADWNSDPECASLAVAESEHRPKDLAIEVLDAVLVTLSAVSSGVAANAIYEVIRSKFASRGRTIEYERMTLMDGSEIVRIRYSDRD